MNRGFKFLAPIVVEDSWAQCENEKCQKWRRLPPGTVVDDSQPWFCYMNPDMSKADCSIPEENYDKDVEVTLTDSQPAAPPPPLPAVKQEYIRRFQQQPVARQKSVNWAASGDLAQPRQSFLTPEPKKRAWSGEADEDWSAAKRPKVKMYTTSRLGANNSWDTDGRGYSSGGGRGQALQAASSGGRGTAKTRKQYKAYEKLVAWGGLWEITKGKGRAITQPPSWVWDGLAVHAPNAAELACRATDVASAAKYFEGHQYPSGMEALQHANHVKRQTMTAAAVLGIAASQGVVDSLPRPVKAETTPVASVISTRAAAQAAAGKGPAPTQAASGGMPTLGGSGGPQSMASAAGSVVPQSVAETAGGAAPHSTPGADGGYQAQQQASVPLSGSAGPMSGQGSAPQQQQAPASQGGYMDAASQPGGSYMHQVPLTQNVHLAPLPAVGSGWSQHAPVPMQQPASGRPELPAAAPPGPSAPVQQLPEAQPATSSAHQTH
eukprot:jgi/Astpho2/7995/Aster-x1473